MAVIGRRRVTKPRGLLVHAISLTRLFLLSTIVVVLLRQVNIIRGAKNNDMAAATLMWVVYQTAPPVSLPSFSSPSGLTRSIRSWYSFLVFSSVESHSLLPLTSIRLNYIHSTITFYVHCTKNKKSVL